MMNTYETLIKRAKLFRAGFRTDRPELLLPVVVWAVFLIAMSVRSDFDFFAAVGTVIACVLAILLYVGMVVLIQRIASKGLSPKTVEADFEIMRAELGVPDPELFNEMLEGMSCFENFIFVDHRYLLDFWSLRIVPVRNIFNVEKYSVYHRRNRYFIMVIADKPLKIACRNLRSQEELFNALDQAVKEIERMQEKGGSVSEWNMRRTSGDAEMDELNTDK